MRTVAAIALLALVTACGSPPQAVTPPPSSPSSSTSPAPQGMPVSEPVSLDIPKIAARSTLVPLGLNPDNTVQVPPVSTPMQAGWYSQGPTPGEIGPAVILGHVDGNKQAGIFFRLRELVPGDQISVARKDGSTVRFAVRKVDKVPKDSFPTEAVYGDTTSAELRLITCGGAFDKTAHSYVDNIIVYATLVY